MEEYEELIKYSTRLKDSQEKHREYNRFYYVDFYLSFAYYEMNDLERVFDHFMRDSYSAILFKNPVDVYFITQMPGFKIAAKNLQIEPKFIQQLYDIIETNDN